MNFKALTVLPSRKFPGGAMHMIYKDTVIISVKRYRNKLHVESVFTASVPVLRRGYAPATFLGLSTPLFLP